jgi:hypothetical protein
MFPQKEIDRTAEVYGWIITAAEYAAEIPVECM